jgi:hypothetical protein
MASQPPKTPPPAFPTRWTSGVGTHPFHHRRLVSGRVEPAPTLLASAFKDCLGVRRTGRPRSYPAFRPLIDRACLAAFFSAASLPWIGKSISSILN